jgi:hypothetical protein
MHVGVVVISVTSACRQDTQQATAVRWKYSANSSGKLRLLVSDDSKKRGAFIFMIQQSSSHCLSLEIKK